MHSNYNLLMLSDSRLLNSNGQTIYYKERIEGRNMKITDTIKYVGVNDHQVDLFEGQYAVPNGMAYNSYVILDDKVAVMDTVDANFKHEWLDNLEQALGGRKPDYLIVQHMEPDHAANVANFWKYIPHYSSSQCEDICNDQEFLRTGSGRAETGSREWFYTESGKSQSYFCICANGTLAGGYGDL